VSICLAYVHPGFVRNEFMASVLAMMPVEIVSVESGTNLQTARNECVRRFLLTDADYLFFVDTDMEWGADVPSRLIACDVPIVSALYLGRSGGETFPVGHGWARVGDSKQIVNLTYEDMDGLVEVAGVGMGCAMIRREVVEALMDAPHEQRDWPFAVGEVASPMVGQVVVSEDVNFCLRAADLGYRSYIASDIPVGHVKPTVLRP
jgi:hypothetical protein